MQDAECVFNVSINFDSLVYIFFLFMFEVEF